MGLFRLFNSSDDEALYPSYLIADKKALSELTAGDTKTVEYTLMRRALSGFLETPFERVDPTTYSLRIGLFLNSDRSQLAYQNAFADDAANFLKRGTFSLQGAAAAAVANAPYQVSATLEIEITDADGFDQTVYRNTNITLKKGLIDVAAAAPQPGEIAATQAWVKGTFLPKDGSRSENPVTGFYVLSRPSKKKLFIYWNDDAQPQVQRFS